MTKVDPTPREVIEEIARLHERELTAAEAAALVSTPIGDDERQATLELIDWFTRRYPTPRDRLAYTRKAYAAWTRNRAGSR